MESKVYCSKCIHYNSDINKIANRPELADTNFYATCMAPQNIKDTNLVQYSDYFISSPEIINRFNNCRWYQSIDEEKPKTIFKLSNLMYDGDYVFQLLNNEEDYTIDLLNYGSQTYQWKCTIKDLLWSRDLYNIVGRDTTFLLNGKIKNSNLCDLTIRIFGTIMTEHGVVLDLIKDSFDIKKDNDVEFEHIALTNISKFNNVVLTRDDKLTISLIIDPDFNKDEECSIDDSNPNCSGEDDNYLWNIELESVSVEIK